MKSFERTKGDRNDTARGQSGLAFRSRDPNLILYNMQLSNASVPEKQNTQ